MQIALFLSPKTDMNSKKNYAVKASFLVKRLQILFSGFKKTKSFRPDYFINLEGVTPYNDGKQILLLSNVYHLDLKRWKPNFLTQINFKTCNTC